MLKTSIQLKNKEKITAILMQIIDNSYEELKEEEVLLCLECCDVDLEVATSNHYDFEEAIKENFELDPFGDVIDDGGFRKLMFELNECFIELHKQSGLFDFFPEGEYEVDGEVRESDTEMIAAKGIYYAPFEDALK